MMQKGCMYVCMLQDTEDRNEETRDEWMDWLGWLLGI